MRSFGDGPGYTGLGLKELLRGVEEGWAVRVPVTGVVYVGVSVSGRRSRDSSTGSSGTSRDSLSPSSSWGRVGS